MNVERQDRVALGIALLTAAGSVMWFGGRVLSKAGHEPVEIATATVATHLAPPAETVSPRAARVWERPPNQSAGENWVYEVFTPPEIRQDLQRGSFFVRTPVAAASATVTHAADAIEFGLELLMVARAPFRLQLVGYVGSADQCQGVFEDQFTGRTLLVSGGERAGELDYLVESVAVGRLPLSSKHPDTVRPVARAVIRDVRTGERVELNDQWPTLSDAAVATVSLAGENGRRRTVRAGDEIIADDAVFRIGKIQLAPPSLETTKVSSRSPSPESRILFVPTTELAGVAQPTL